jgi:hypothetical protein
VEAVGKLNYKGNFSTAPTSLGKTLRKKQKRREFSTVPTASAAGFNLGRETGEQSRNLLREVAGTCLGKLIVNRERGWLPRKCKSQPARGKFFLDSSLS